MLKFILPPLLLVSSICFGQTNYNTILAPKVDSIQKPIDLRLQKKERLETMGNLFFAGSVVSTIVMYNIEPKTPVLFIMPATLAITGIVLMGTSWKYDDE